MKKFISGVVIGLISALVITAFLFAHFWPRPGPDPEPVVVTVKEPVYISDISGQATIPERPTPPGEPEKTYCFDFKVSVPVSGEFVTENATVKVAGETVVERSGDLLLVDTVFYDAEINVKHKPPPEPPKKLFEIGVYVYTDFDESGIGWYFEKDWIIKETRFVNIMSFYRYQSDTERHYAGFKGSF